MYVCIYVTRSCEQDSRICVSHIYLSMCTFLCQTLGKALEESCCFFIRARACMHVHTYSHDCAATMHADESLYVHVCMCILTHMTLLPPYKQTNPVASFGDWGDELGSRHRQRDIHQRGKDAPNWRHTTEGICSKHHIIFHQNYCGQFCIPARRSRRFSKYSCVRVCVKIWLRLQLRLRLRLRQNIQDI